MGFSANRFTFRGLLPPPSDLNFGNLSYIVASDDKEAALQPLVTSLDLRGGRASFQVLFSKYNTFSSGKSLQVLSLSPCDFEDMSTTKASSPISDASESVVSSFGSCLLGKTGFQKANGVGSSSHCLIENSKHVLTKGSEDMAVMLLKDVKGIS